MQVAATHAALLLAQGSGRLIRTHAGKGVVAVLDPRLVTARYGSVLKASLPPMWTTTDPAVVRKALARLFGAQLPTQGASATSKRRQPRPESMVPRQVDTENLSFSDAPADW
jgi:superfamily II DNA or RNA helicase